MLIDGVEVPFPFEAYECQVRLMSAVLRALRERRDAILESPTGTGKTLCLLAAALSFAKPRNLKVVYASRTHAQLGQAIGQLGLIGRFKVAWLAGRDKLCNVPEVRSLKGEAQAKACKAAKCPKPRAYARATDIEDLAKAYAAKGACGFFAARAQATGAEIAFAPHALMDGFKSAILIVDEAHHITGEVPDAYCRLFASGTMVGVSPKLRRNPLRLENDHCISPSQLEALIVPTIEGRDLKFTKAHRPMDDVTYIISTLPRRSVVFFPSYEFLDQALKLVPFAAVDQKNWTHLLFGVCRGKLAEGIDLKCDCVMIVGVPLAPEGGSSRDADAMRAVNQALGRLIRHKSDFGVLVLADLRYRTHYKSLLPKWVRDSGLAEIDAKDVSQRARSFLARFSSASNSSSSSSLMSKKRPLAAAGSVNLPPKRTLPFPSGGDPEEPQKPKVSCFEDKRPPTSTHPRPLPPKKPPIIIPWPDLSSNTSLKHSTPPNRHLPLSHPAQLKKPSRNTTPPPPAPRPKLGSRRARRILSLTE